MRQQIRLDKMSKLQHVSTTDNTDKKVELVVMTGGSNSIFYIQCDLKLFPFPQGV